ncbi:trichohyalin-like protein [Leptotrombidium deliense]|uniref:Trichohyalin-like protein n=1 Tax=Leptotrombidium deliense TaxID=299467 RepID=A0A443STY9_9ACAR|nr:trichohyalin-like protein [Leptotrombidium deliense]
MASLEPSNELSRCNSFISSRSVISDTEIESCCHLYAAQTNSRLLHVLSDLVKAFLDTEHDIQKSLENMGFPCHESSCSREEILPSLEDAIERLSHADGVNELCEDGPECISPSTTFYSSLTVTSGIVNSVSAGNAEDDILLGASRRLRSAVSRILHLLQELATHQFPDKFISSSDDVIRVKNSETEDLKVQLESSSKQILSYQKFIEQQAKEREFERDEFNIALQKIEEKFKEKERKESKLRTELEAYESQLTSLADDKKELEQKLRDVSLQLKKSSEITEEYKQVIQQMEKENEEFTRNERVLKKKVNELEEAIHLQASLNEEMQKEHLNNSNSLASAVIESINLRTSQLQRTLNMGEIIDLSGLSVSLLSSKPDVNYNTSNAEDSSTECSYADVNILDDKMRLLNTCIDKLVAQNVKLRSDLEYVNSNNKNLDDKFNKLLEEKSRLENELREVKREEEIIQEELNNKRLQLSALKSRVEGNVAWDVSQLKQTNEELKRNLAKEESKCETLKQQIAQLTVVNEERDLKIKQLTDEIRAVSAAVASVKNNFIKVEMEKIRLAKAESDLLKEKEAFMKQETVFRNEIDTLHQERDELTHKLSNTVKNDNQEVLSKLLRKVIRDKNEEIKCLSQQLRSIEDKLSPLCPKSNGGDVLSLVEELLHNVFDLKTKLKGDFEAKACVTVRTIEAAVNTENSSCVQRASKATNTIVQCEDERRVTILKCEKESLEEELRLCKQRLNDLCSKFKLCDEENSALKQAIITLREKEIAYRPDQRESYSDTEADVEMAENNLQDALETLHNNSQELLILSESRKKQKEAILRQLIETLPFVVSEDRNNTQCILHDEWRLQFLDSFPQKEIGALLFEKLKQINAVYFECNTKMKYYCREYEAVANKLVTVEKELANVQQDVVRYQKDCEKMKEKVKHFEQKMKDTENVKSELEERVETYRTSYKVAKEETNKLEKQIRELERSIPKKVTLDQNDIYLKLRRCLSHKKSLIFQKKYLLNVLGGFQLTEKATLALLANLNISMLHHLNRNAATGADQHLTQVSPVFAAHVQKQTPL